MKSTRAQGPRITAGMWKGRKVHAPEALDPTRPTPGLLREALFSILGERLFEGAFLDLFGGTGSVAFEAVSRGASRAVVVENHPEALRCLERTAQDLKSGDSLRVVRSEVRRFVSHPEGGAFSVVFADPPFGAIPEDLPLLCARVCAPAGVVALQLPSTFQASWLEREGIDRRRYGSSCLVMAAPEVFLQV